VARNIPAMLRTATAAPNTTPSAAKPRKPATPQHVPAVPFARWAGHQNLSAMDLAAMLKLHPSTVWELLSGRRWPSARTVLQIYEASGGAVRLWDAYELTKRIRVRVRPPEPRLRRAQDQSLAEGR
jgi:plasmid maintenance system antidote protein VapI